jgi:uncharacterized protein (TIGR02186 family)
VNGRKLSLLLGALAALACLAQAQAERLVTSISTHRVLISSNFTGTDIVLFGQIDDEDKPTTQSGYDLVVTVVGPPENFVTRRKERILGIWLNYDSRQFLEAPSYLAVLTSKPPAQLGLPEFLRRNRIGVVNHTFQQRVGTDFADVEPQDAFRTAFLRVKERENLYNEEPQGVTFLTPTLFRATVPIPGTAPTGTYRVETMLVSEGKVIAREETAVEVVKTGFEELVARAARDHGFLYGLSTAFLALMTGFLASFIFRRD